MVYIDINGSNTHADPLLGSRWAQMWIHMWVHTLVIFLVYVTKGNMEWHCFLACTRVLNVRKEKLKETCFNHCENPQVG